MMALVVQQPVVEVEVGLVRGVFCQIFFLK